jgi:hypothetical protein
MWTARSGQIVPDNLDIEVRKMLKISYLLYYKAEFFACVILTTKDKTAIVCCTQQRIILKRGVNIWHNRPPKIYILYLRNKD